MKKIVYLDRVSGKHEEERVYGRQALELIYGDSWLSRFLGKALLHFLIKWPFFSWIYGRLQNSPRSKKKIIPFIKKFHVDTTDFLNPVASYSSFNDFFSRKLKPDARPIDPRDHVVTAPADGRYLFFQDVGKSDGLVVKGEKFSLSSLLKDEGLASQYANGSMVIVRLCPTDYHRFHFPCDCVPGVSTLLNGWLYSVNPLSL